MKSGLLAGPQIRKIAIIIIVIIIILIIRPSSKILFYSSFHLQNSDKSPKPYYMVNEYGELNKFILLGGRE